MLLSQTEPQDKAVSHHRNESLVLPSTRQSAPVSPPGLVVWAVRTVAADYVRLCACVCFDRPSRMAARVWKWPKAATNVSRLSSRVVCVLLVEDATWMGSSRVCLIG